MLAPDLTKHTLIIHPAKPYMCSLLLENEPTSIYSHLTRNEEWKLWVGWHSSSCWLLFLCVLCFVFCATSKQSSVLECHHTILYFEKWKLWALFFDGFLRRSNNNRKKLWQEKRYSHLAISWNKSQVNHLSSQKTNTNYHRKNYDRKKKIQSSGHWLEYMSKYKHQLQPEKLQPEKKVQSSCLHHLQYT